MERARWQASLATPPFHSWTFPDGTLWTEFHRADGGYLLRFPQLADFLVAADARTVSCFPVFDVSEATTQHLYLNQVLPLVLSKLGKQVFHASAVEIGAGAVAFLGESGRGKSTLAASLAVSGCRFLTDDGLVVEPSAGGFKALPSHPSIRLWEDSEAALMSPSARRAPAVHYTAKARFLADEDLAFCAVPRSLRRVYVLGDGAAEDVIIEPLTAAQTLVELVKHSFILDIEEQSRLASHFDQVATLANHQIHYRLDYPRQFEKLTAVQQAVFSHIYEEDHAT